MTPSSYGLTARDDSYDGSIHMSSASPRAAALASSESSTRHASHVVCAPSAHTTRHCALPMKRRKASTCATPLAARASAGGVGGHALAPLAFAVRTDPGPAPELRDLRLPRASACGLRSLRAAPREADEEFVDDAGGRSVRLKTA